MRKSLGNAKELNPVLQGEKQVFYLCAMQSLCLVGFVNNCLFSEPEAARRAEGGHAEGPGAGEVFEGGDPASEGGAEGQAGGQQEEEGGERKKDGSRPVGQFNTFLSNSS